jgi:peptide/nickel transport system permease protein
MLLSSSVGSILGVFTGYLGGKVDRIITLVMDAFWAIPGFITALLVSTLLGSSTLNLSIAIGVGWIPSFYRNVRSLSISLREEDFTYAEIAMGASDLYIVLYHILPLCFSVIVVIMTIGIAHSIIVSAGLGFLGLGVPPPTPELGVDLAQGRQAIASGVWWTIFGPSLFIFIMVIGFNLLGEGLNEILGTTLKEV